MQKAEVFTSDAIAMLQEAALGSLRDGDRVTTAALKTACRRRRKLVERDVIGKSSPRTVVTTVAGRARVAPWTAIASSGG